VPLFLTRKERTSQWITSRQQRNELVLVVVVSRAIIVACTTTTTSSTTSRTLLVDTGSRAENGRCMAILLPVLLLLLLLIFVVFVVFMLVLLVLVLLFQPDLLVLPCLLLTRIPALPVLEACEIEFIELFFPIIFKSWQT
jgi:hypothetical protein